MQILKDWRQVIEQQAKETKSYLLNAKETARNYEHSSRTKSEIGFNVFTISSDLYYRENFHSDIIKAFLDPNEKHGEGNKFLNAFIHLLNKCNPQRNLNPSDFENSRVSREENNIDILISDSNSGKAILIENKIYNAIDQQRQIPRYFEIVSENYSVEAIVYLTLTSSKYLNQNDWTNDEIENINPLIYFVPSYNLGSTNLFDNWIVPSIIECNNSESLFILRQYGNLIKFLNTNSMDTITLEKFYLTLKESDNLRTSLSVRNMLNDLPEYLAIRIEGKYKGKCYPFKSIWRYKSRDAVFEAFELENLYLKMDIWCSEKGYKVHFWNSKDEHYDIKVNLPFVLSLKDFNYEGDNKSNVEKHFGFNEEELLFEFIDNLLLELKEFKNQPVSNLVIEKHD
ncbi:hypothetical protein QF042_001732 [Pedobacter sp. W3I1]|uniref:PDDEXK-like family protein n=1 Tax=Pedobacter sp. W3I1 TaxID=3042291 RepID=UPI00278A242E|nr:PD-(D/E)XK nuclease family protein [Pedobacter sp. W3I1]MDQ0638167.1 hypothetical protein [Pedobacter sp. W3I1]